MRKKVLTNLKECGNIKKKIAYMRQREVIT